MSDFLQFMNTASADSLTQISGISTSLAESLIAARPFESVDDCLKVHGMGKTLLARAQTSFESMDADNKAENRALIPVEEQDNRGDAPLGKSRPMEDMAPRETKPSFGSRLGQAVLWFFRTLLRLILIVLVIGGIGAAVYYGVPYINERFIAPLEQNIVYVTELENEIETLQAQLTEVNRQIADVNIQLNEVNERLNENNNRFDELEQAVDAHTATLVTLADMQATLEAKLEEGDDKTLLALKQEITLTRSLDMLSRARLYLAQSNFGLAKADVQSAHDLLFELQAGINDEALAQAIERLDMTLDNLPAFPVVASGDLEIAWQILMTGESAPTPTPESTPEASTTPEAAPEITPTSTTTP